MALVVYETRQWTAPLPAMGTVLAGSIFGAVAFIGLLYCFRRALFLEILDFIRILRSQLSEKEAVSGT
jgi:hypothetical protein